MSQERWTAGSALKSEFIKKHGRFGRQAVGFAFVGFRV